ncbi:MAG TPA: hypothetical protein VFV38_33130 [Ktedonobacteraceae bacterium]|nr:hypothetical protein [Ktedonobacteraceae bacterium]
MPNVKQLLTTIDTLVVEPLFHFEEMAIYIDDLHAITHKKFADNIKSLFEGNPPAMQGQGATALWQKMQDYEDAEANEMGHGNGSLSLAIEVAGIFCRAAARNIRSLIEDFPDTGILDEIIGGPVDWPMIDVQTQDLEITAFLDTPNQTYRVSFDQLTYLEEMGAQRRKWGFKMKELSQDAALERPLPDPPNSLPMAFITLPPVTLTPAQQQEVSDIMHILDVEGITGVNQQYIEELINEGFSEADILAAIEGWKAAGKTNEQINDLLYLAAFHILLGPYYRNDMVPRGMTAQQYQQFVSTLRNGLNAAGYCSGAGIGGSTVTGYKYTTGRPFDGDPNDPSDYDIALTGNEIWERAKALGIKLRDGGTHTGPLTPEEIQELGLTDLINQLEAIAGQNSPTGHREVHFMIYNSLAATSARAPYIYFFGNSCAGK